MEITINRLNGASNHQYYDVPSFYIFWCWNMFGCMYAILRIAKRWQTEFSNSFPMFSNYSTVCVCVSNIYSNCRCKAHLIALWRTRSYKAIIWIHNTHMHSDYIGHQFSDTCEWNPNSVYIHIYIYIQICLEACTRNLRNNSCRLSLQSKAAWRGSPLCSAEPFFDIAGWWWNLILPCSFLHKLCSCCSTTNDKGIS